LFDRTHEAHLLIHYTLLEWWGTVLWVTITWLFSLWWLECYEQPGPSYGEKKCCPSLEFLEFCSLGKQWLQRLGLEDGEEQRKQQRKSHVGVLYLHFQMSLLSFAWHEYRVLSTQFLVQFVVAGDVCCKVVFCMIFGRSFLWLKNGSFCASPQVSLSSLAESNLLSLVIYSLLISLHLSSA
jgi:hypothetical protein